MSTDVIRSIALDKLVKSPANVRKTPPSEAEQAELKANIAAHPVPEEPQRCAAAVRDRLQG